MAPRRTVRPEHKKALIGAFFALGVCMPLAAAADACWLSSAGTDKGEVSSISDGDTVRLRDGRILRLLNIDTPELAHKANERDQPLAREARKTLGFMLAKGSALELRHDLEPRDRFARDLVQLRTADGRDPALLLLQQGLATVFVLPPNTHLADCYLAAQRQAQQEKVGLWALPAYQPQAADTVAANYRGFLRVHGRVTERKSRGDSLKLRLGQHVYIHLSAKALASMPDWQPPAPGQRLSVYGKATAKKDGSVHISLFSGYQLER